MKIQISDHIKTLLESRNGLAQEVNTEGVGILEAKAAADTAHKADCPCKSKTGDCTDTDYQSALKAIEDRISVQKSKRTEIGSIDELIGSAEQLEMKSFEEEREQKQVTKGGMSPVMQDALYGGKKAPLFERIATDFQKFLHDGNFDTKDGVYGRPASVEALKSGEKFNSVASFHIAFGTSQQEIISSSKSMATELGLSDDVQTALKARREEAMKSMFTQQPGLSGGSGGMYAPTAVFAGNTGGLCEYMIDNTIDVLPYPEASFLDCIPVRRIPKSYVLYVRQTLRVNNASAVNESLQVGVNNPQTPGVAVDFRVMKPESEFGFSQAKAYTLTFADTLPVSEEFLEDCPAIADAVENQLMENVRQEFYDQIINGDGSTGQYPELIGLLAQVGMSTRVHQGAASFLGQPQGPGSVDDNIYETLVRAIFDAEAFGYTVDCILMSIEDYTDMFFLKNGNEEPLYTEAQLNTIRGAKVRKDVRMPPGTALVGAFRQVVQLLIRRALRLDIGWVDSQFKQDMLTLRATLRGGLLVRAPHALIRVTGI